MRLFEVVNNEEREDGFNSKIMTEDELLEFAEIEEEENDTEDAINSLWEQGYKVYDIAKSYFE